MKTSEDIHALIKALKPTEKAYFKKYARLHVIGKSNRYVLLFDAINKQEKYDEKKLIEKFRGYGFARRFAVAKEYLYQQIRYALESYHHSIHSDIKSLLHWAEILNEKELFKQSHKAITKAKQLARKHEMHHALMEIYRHWEIKLALQKADVPWTQNIIREETEELSLAQNTKAYRDVSFSIINYYNLYGAIRDKKHIGQIKKMMRSRLLTDENKAITFEARLRFHEAHCFYFRIINDKRRLYSASKDVIYLFKKYPEKIRYSVSSFIVYLNNMLDACSMNQKYDEIPHYLEEFESLAPLAKSSNEKEKLFYFIAINYLNYYVITGQFQDAVSYVAGIKQQLDRHEHSLSHLKKALLFHNIALSYMGTGEYKSCIHWINRIKNEIPLKSIRSDLESFLHLFYLIAQYEAGNMDLLPSLIRSVYRFFRKKGQLYKFEIVLLDFFRNELPETNTEKELMQAFQKLKNKFTPLSQDPHEKIPFDFFDYMSWLESKIEKKPFAEVVRSRLKANSPGE